MKHNKVKILNRQFIFNGPKDDEYFKIYQNDRGEKDLLNVLAASTSISDYVLDVGANLGFTTLALSNLVVEGKVFAFEPGINTYRYLSKNIKANSFTNAVLKNYGLSDLNQSANLSYSLDNYSGAFVNENVTKQKLQGFGQDSIKLVKLDHVYKELGISKCSLIKIDIEGHEPNFLKGAKKFIATYKPLAVIEANHWCLNIFNRTSLPEFIDELFSYFPHVFAFDNGDYFELRDDKSRYKFFYENTVNLSYMNLYCGFDKKLLLKNLKKAFPASYIKEGKENRETLQKKVNKLSSENIRLNNDIDRLANDIDRLANDLEKLRNSKSQKIAAKINGVIGRR